MGRPKPARRVTTGPRPRQGNTPRVNVTRAEFNAVLRVLEERGDIIAQMRHDLDVQFRRIADLQAELDDVKRASGR